MKRHLLMHVFENKSAAVHEDQFLKHIFRLAHFVEFFEYLTAYAMLSGGRRLAPTLIGRSPRVQGLYPLFAEWIARYFVEGEATRPPVNETQGMAFVSMMLDGAEAHLLSVRALAEAEKVSAARAMIDGLFQAQSDTWILSSNFVSNIGHFVYGATLLELQGRGRLTRQTMRVLTGASRNPFMLQAFQPHLLAGMPAGVQYAEMISARKRHRMADGRWASMSELVSEAAAAWATDRPFAGVDPETRARGDAALAELGVSPDEPIVTLHVREAGYNDNIAQAMSLRDARIADYRDAVAALVGNGIHVVRLGDRTMTRAEPQDGLLDYPFTDAKSDWMDVYLAVRCRFHIGTSSGMSFVPLMFGRPVLFTNWITLAHIVCSPSVVTMPKLLLDREGGLVPMAEYCGRHGHVLERSDAALHGLSFRDNAPEDLVEAVQLMDRHIDPTSGRLSVPDGMFEAPQTVFAESPLKSRPQIPPAFWNRYYAGR
ncbi:TIGR04372 family glycosyltransferase [Thalassobaculum sp.]|uniref:TIGR04372 family glycosyltransferase n=1 Tax=Thalassobaculum sp. TaxID=2022740 RepID=UPI0032ED2498